MKKPKRSWSKSARAKRYILENKIQKFAAIAKFEEALQNLVANGFDYNDVHEIIHIYEHGTLNI